MDSFFLPVAIMIASLTDIVMAKVFYNMFMSRVCSFFWHNYLVQPCPTRSVPRSHFFINFGPSLCPILDCNKRIRQTLLVTPEIRTARRQHSCGKHSCEKPTERQKKRAKVKYTNRYKILILTQLIQKVLNSAGFTYNSVTSVCYPFQNPLVVWYKSFLIHEALSLVLFASAQRFGLSVKIVLQDYLRLSKTM